MQRSKLFLAIMMILFGGALAGRMSVSELPLKTEFGIDVEKGLVAYWKFDEGAGDIAFDETQNNNDCGLLCTGENCSPPKWTEGKIGYALEFDGVDDYVACGNNESLEFGTGDLTITAWINSRIFDTGGQHQYIFNRGWGDQDKHKGYGFYFQWEPTYWHYTLRFGIGDGTNGAKTVDVRPKYFDDKNNQWFFVVAKREGDTIYVYLNGEEWSTGDASNITDISVKGSWNDTVYMGKLVQPGSGTNFNGVIDEVRVYNRALTQAEIQALYHKAL
jgi:hypothetical protein